MGQERASRAGPEAQLHQRHLATRAGPLYCRLAVLQVPFYCRPLCTHLLVVADAALGGCPTRDKADDRQLPHHLQGGCAHGGGQRALRAVVCTLSLAGAAGGLWRELRTLLSSIPGEARARLLRQEKRHKQAAKLHRMQGGLGCLVCCHELSSQPPASPCASCRRQSPCGMSKEAQPPCSAASCPAAAETRVSHLLCSGETRLRQPACVCGYSRVAQSKGRLLAKSRIPGARVPCPLTPAAAPGSAHAAAVAPRPGRHCCIVVMLALVLLQMRARNRGG